MILIITDAKSHFDKNKIISGGEDRKVKISDYSSFDKKNISSKSICSHKYSIRSLKVSPSKNKIFSTSEHRDLKISTIGIHNIKTDSLQSMIKAGKDIFHDAPIN